MSNVVVTGAASGIGLAVAEACIARGDRVIGIDLDGAELRCDVSDPAQVEAAAVAAVDMLGTVDLVVHAAGVSISGRALKATADDVRFVIDVNVLGTMYVAHSFAGRMAAQSGESCLALVGSEHSIGVPHLFSAAYTASKHAVLGYADVLRRELPEHVQVTVLCPGLVATDLWRSQERRGPLHGGPREVASDAGALMAQGMPADEVAERLLAGVAAGEFLVVTHGHARAFADERYRLIADAFDRQAPAVDDDRYALGRLVPPLAP
ncbi:SDR family NAD(P)-dependent oxidoreductase [Nocardioides sp. Iso805N]|uniref:SDR family NAD(P)-dependent oxidoreductase n=1 Tax=Nocardioides sp. Iso805N TaxID=1283287 RepID=UPI00036995E7|nr:SDR family NAD(P)-dependent oxidoreductase [Nocardioides sp. Iso805N]